ncbi:hypothetical protein B0H17DRAFT_1331721 [Mycena rosella]|uniref:DUF6533 domain-containing protein n=1 Tax=Mycena rosella TaxID=1033263 RepID=A0AAD7DF19_MYCRO|nr:hypothetical protein B0H17DRAFT_1331721 [Mycena rosella]
MSSNAVLGATLVPTTLWACATVLAYDWICTLDQEILYVWTGPRWSMATLFFVLNRYLPFIDVGIALSELHIHNPLPGILMLRTAALWERKRGVLISLFTIYICTLISAAVFIQLELASLEYISTNKVGCKLARVGSIGIFSYLMLLMSETTIVAMTAVKAYRDLRYSRQPWIVQLYRDGILFYVYLLVISVANILVPILAPSMFSNWLATPQRVLHSVLCTRVLLLIRGRSVGWNGLEDYVNSSAHESELAFASARSESSSFLGDASSVADSEVNGAAARADICAGQGDGVVHSTQDDG